LSRPRRRIRSSDDEHDREHHDGDAGHHPGLNTARQNSARNGAMIRDGSWRRVSSVFRSRRGLGHTSPPLLQELESLLAERQVTDVTGSKIAMVNDTCGNIIQVTQLMRW